MAASAYFVAMESGLTAASRNRLAAADLAGDGLDATVLSVDGARMERIALSAEERAEPATR